MIKFFRHIRKSLLEQNKMGKYFKYAIGEILLVVIGILIALQINNWNENRKLRLVELELLENIKSDLMQSKISIDDMVSNNTGQIAMYKKLLYYVKEDLPEHKGLYRYFGNIPTWTTPYLYFSAYETLKIKGVDLIQNDSLKTQIIDMYDNEYAYLIGDWDKWEWNNNQSISMPFYTKHFRRDSIDVNIAKPNNFEALKDNDEFSNIISLLLFTRTKGVREGKRIALKLEELINSIESELDQR
ncbi:DUF6090 family protein [Winogradskyella alexanderae]|uniref:Uncharacterized protein n=1 Tax=Winogradskyella alexanderae TaxID=2877123 RepID=A0ABS7XVL2_9FLAO|nr:DUF6090 family protein [Winogradskyella alexanderae]MCA0133800.1 hypothetical protein [Winogradskyella alexanderae]